ncbi:hypothetical protein HPB47_017027 [Ixodes persulcatus]|uniref:Uncharacterized protein n=1 Tax=Ixodes persulcatus TaxID=34615 RepID=A0AC60QPD8_IXOPE|nr:hypothetical protein HPB47_017027 [Ixodes persulcatus]
MLAAAHAGPALEVGSGHGLFAAELELGGVVAQEGVSRDNPRVAPDDNPNRTHPPGSPAISVVARNLRPASHLVPASTDLHLGPTQSQPERRDQLSSAPSPGLVSEFHGWRLGLPKSCSTSLSVYFAASLSLSRTDFHGGITMLALSLSPRKQTDLLWEYLSPFNQSAARRLHKASSFDHLLPGFITYLFSRDSDGERKTIRRKSPAPKRLPEIKQTLPRGLSRGSAREFCCSAVGQAP